MSRVDLTKARENVFRCIAIAHTTTDDTLRGGLKLDDGVWVLAENPFELNRDAKSTYDCWLRQRFPESNFLLALSMPLDACGVTLNKIDLPDHVTTPVDERLNALFFGMLLQGMLKWADAFRFTGCRDDGRLTAFQIQRLHRYYFQKDTPTLAITSDVVATAYRLAEGIRELWRHDYKSCRLAKGFEANTRALRENWNEYRIYEFARSIDGILKAANSNRFQDRLQELIPDATVSDSELKEVYAIRSEVAHLNNWGTALSKYRDDDKVSALARRCMQAEVLAAVLYRHVLCRAELREGLLTDAAVDGFWRRSKSKRREMWGDVELSEHEKQRLRWNPQDC